MFCFAEDNQIISAMEIKITNRNEKKPRFSTKFRLSGIVDREITNCFSLYVWVVHRVVSLTDKYSVKHPKCIWYKICKV